MASDRTICRSRQGLLPTAAHGSPILVAHCIGADLHVLPGNPQGLDSGFILDAARWTHPAISFFQVMIFTFMILHSAKKFSES